jgi:hypothetical protein
MSMEMIKDKYMFLQEDTGGGGGGDIGGGGESQGASVFEGGSGGGEAQQREAPAPSRGEARVDARELAQEFGNVIGQHFQHSQAPQQPQMTVEEAKRLLNVWEPSQEWLAKYDNLESRIPALVDMRDGFIRQADTIAQYRMNELLGRMQQTYGPVVQYMQTQEARAGEYRFKDSYPELAHDNLRPLLFAVSQNLLAQGIPFRSERELFSAIANGVEAVIKVNNPEFRLGSGNGSQGPLRQQGQQPAQGSIPVTTPGSGGGGGRGGTGPPKPRGLSVFD